MSLANTGFKRLIYAVRARNPDLSEGEAQEIARRVLKKIAEIVAGGELIAFLRTSQEGVDELITYELKRFNRNS